VPVQSVNYRNLRPQLVADGQILKWALSSPLIQRHRDDGKHGARRGGGGSWNVGANAGGWPLPNGTYLHDGTRCGKSVRFSPTITRTDITMHISGGSMIRTGRTTHRYDRERDSDEYGGHQPADSVHELGEDRFEQLFQTSVQAGRDDHERRASGYVIANAVRFMPLREHRAEPPAILPVVQVVASDAVAANLGRIPRGSRWSAPMARTMRRSR